MVKLYADEQFPLPVVKILRTSVKIINCKAIAMLIRAN
jgi:hypothetical protein